MKSLKIVIYVFIVGGLGGITNSIMVWLLGALGVIFLIPIYENAPIKKGAILSILPWLSSVLYVFPVRMDVGFFGLEFGNGTPPMDALICCYMGDNGNIVFVQVCSKISGADMLGVQVSDLIIDTIGGMQDA